MKILIIANFAYLYFPAFSVDKTCGDGEFKGKKLSVFTSGDFNFSESATRLTLPGSSMVMEGGNNGFAYDH